MNFSNVNIKTDKSAISELLDVLLFVIIENLLYRK